ncbi:MAG: hypothetical protein BWY76_02189 [bacterium ADurb.Bin429]|nr:MAG: hypothetical protein BWY76_02189 [bacterium ADurb.Bin429]
MTREAVIPEIIRWEDRECNGIYKRHLYGLMIFSMNDVQGVEDAMVTFLRALVSTYPCAAQIGMMALEGEEPRDLFVPLKEGTDYFLTAIDSYSHGGIRSAMERPGGCFFPHLTPSFFEMPYSEERSLIQYLLGYDHPILYVNVCGTDLQLLHDLYRQPPACNSSRYEDCWWSEVTACVPLGLRGGHDDGMYTAYTCNPSHFHFLDAPLAETRAAIRATPWFQEHAHELRWRDENDGLALMLPEIIETEKAAETQRQEKLRMLQQSQNESSSHP